MHDTGAGGRHERGAAATEVCEAPGGEKVEWPQGSALVSNGILVALSVFALVGDGPVRAEVAVLLAVAVSPWLVPARVAARIPLPVVTRELVAAAVFLVPVAVINLAGHRLGWFPAPDDAQSTLMLLTFVVGEKASTKPRSVSLPFSVAAVALVVARRVIAPEFDAVLVWVIAVLLVAVGGMLVHHQMRVTTELRRTQAALATEVAAAERARIAREVHDTVAHTLAVTVLHLSAARLAVRRDPDAAEDAIRRAEELGRQSLADVRRSVGLLRRGEHGATDAALPTIGDLGGLVAQYRSAGMAVELTVGGLAATPEGPSNGDVPPSLRPAAADAAPAGAPTLSPAQELAVYRVVQEALANATRHAPGSAVVVSVACGAAAVEVAVVDDGGGRRPVPPDGEGHGLRGMRERVSALGGTVAFGPHGTGWRVAATLPAAPEVVA